MAVEPLNRSRFYIDQARAHPKTTNPQSTGSVASTLMTVFWRRIYAEEGFCKFGMSRFFNEEIRKANARHDDKPTSDGQLDLWPEVYRPLLRRIDRSEVYVPSRD